MGDDFQIPCAGRREKLSERHGFADLGENAPARLLHRRHAELPPAFRLRVVRYRPLREKRDDRRRPEFRRLLDKVVKPGGVLQYPRPKREPPGGFVHPLGARRDRARRLVPRDRPDERVVRVSLPVDNPDLVPLPHPHHVRHVREFFAPHRQRGRRDRFRRDVEVLHRQMFPRMSMMNCPCPSSFHAYSVLSTTLYGRRKCIPAP